MTLGRQHGIDAEIARLGRSHVHPGPASLIAESALIMRPELQGRVRVRRALGLPPDELDERTAQARTDSARTLDEFVALTLVGIDLLSAGGPD